MPRRGSTATTRSLSIQPASTAPESPAERRPSAVAESPERTTSGLRRRHRETIKINETMEVIELITDENEEKDATQGQVRVFS